MIAAKAASLPLPSRAGQRAGGAPGHPRSTGVQATRDPGHPSISASLIADAAPQQPKTFMPDASILISRNRG